MIKRRTELKWICSLNCEPEVYIVRRGMPPTHKKIQLRNKSKYTVTSWLVRIGHRLFCGMLSCYLSPQETPVYTKLAK